MQNMETPLNDDGITWNLAQVEATKIKMRREKEFGEAFSSELNQNGLPGTSTTSEFKLGKPKLLVNNNVIINYVKLPTDDDSDSNESLPPEEDHTRSLSPDLHLAGNGDNVLPVVGKNTFSVKISKPDAFQLKAEVYNNHVKSSISKPLGGKQIYFRFRVQESLHKIAHSKDAVVYQCHICKGPYKQKFSLKRHFLRNHINPEYISAADISNCKIHTPNGEIIQQFVEESKTPSGRKRFKTNGAIFFVPDGKTRVPGLYKCHQCPGVRFDLEDELEEHYSSHLNLNRDDIFPCNLCPSVFSRKQALSKHMVSHTEKKVIFHCKKCSQQFEKITDYTRHLQSHGSGKRCKYCDKEFSTPANRKRHENIHERGRVFSCKLCKVKFSRGKELEKHIKKMHSNLKLTCPHCPMQANPMIFLSQYLLETHITLKHRDIPGKKFVTSKTTGIYKTHAQKLSKESFCCFCKKRFSSVKAMVNHKNIVHKNEIAMHKPKKFGQKELIKEKSAEVFVGSRKFKNLPNSGKGSCENKATSKADDHSSKTGILGKKRTTYDRKAKSSSQYKLSKDKSYRNNDKANAKFYANVHSNIADNYINHVDGGLNQLNLKYSNFQDQNEPFDYRSNTSEIPWSAQNFSNYFDLDSAMSKREEKSLLFPQEQCLYATGLERNEDAVENTLNLSSENSTVVEETARSYSQDEPLVLDAKEKLISREVCITYVCDVCKGTFSSYSAFEDHSINNHPNVEVSFVEIEGTSNTPPKVPIELRRLPYTQPNGMLVSCEVVLPTQDQFNITCTKCETKFNTKNELYTHIFQCVAETREIHFRKKINQKNRKGLTMKSRTDSSIKSIKSSGWFSWKKQLFKSGCFRRNKFQSRKYYFKTKSNKRGRRRLPVSSKLRANPCPFCESVFISAAKLPEHTEICTYKYKNRTAEEKLKKKCPVKKRKNRQSPELSPSPVTLSENGSSSDAVKNSDTADKDSSLPNYPNCRVLSTESEVASFDANLNLFSANLGVTAPPTDILQPSGAKVNSEETLVLEKAIPNLFHHPEIDALRDIVRKVQVELSKDLPFEDMGESCVKSKKLIPVDFTGKNTVGLKSVDNSLTDNSRKNTAKSTKSTKSEDIVKSFAVATIERLSKISEVGVPNIKEVVKEIKLAASGSPNLKKSNAPLTFLSPEADQNVELSSQNNNSPVLSLQTELNSHSAKESGAMNNSQQVEKARQRKKRKPVKIMHKMTNEAENSLKINLPAFCNMPVDSCLTTRTLVNNSFKPIENSGEQILTTNTNSVIPSLPDLLPEKDKIDFHNSDEKCSTNVLESTTADSSENIQTNTDDQRLSSTVFLLENKREANEDRDSPSLEVLVSSVTQSIENFDKPSLLDDDKFALQAPDMINPITLKNIDMELTSDNGLNFKIIIPAVDSPSKSQLSDKDSLDYFASGISADKSANESLPVSSDKNNVEDGHDMLNSAINKMKSILSVAENGTKHKESINSKVKNDVFPCAENSLPVKDNTEVVIPRLESRSVASSTTVDLLESVPPKSQQNHCLDVNEKELSKKNGEIMGKSVNKVKRSDDKKGEIMGKSVNKVKRSDDKKGEIMGKSVNKEKRSDDKKGVENNTGYNDSSDDGDDDSSDSKKPAQGQFAIAARVDLLSEQKSKQLKDKVKSKMADVVQSKIARNESQKKKVGLKPSLIKKCDSENKKGESPKPPVNNDQPKLAALEINRQLGDENKDKVESGMPSSENAKLRFLRMKKPTSGSSVEIGNKRPGNSSETDNSDNQMSKKKKTSLNCGGVPVEASKDGGCCSKTLDSCHTAEDDKSIVVKKEKADNDQSRHRNCPYCYLDFAYLSNFRRHIRICSSKTGNDANETPVAPPSSQFQHLPKKNEVEDSMLNLKRHQIRQNEFIKETQVTEDNKAKNSFQKFNCPICHKIYLSYFQFIQHKVQSHNLTNQETRSVNDGASTSQGIRVMPLEESGSENNVHQMTTAVNYGASTSQGIRVMPLEETNSNSNLPACGISSELNDNGKDSRTTVESSVKEADQIDDASKNDRNISSDIPADELKSDNKEIKSDPLQNTANCLENINNSDSPNLTEKVMNTHPSIKISLSPDGRNVSNPNHDQELANPSLLTLPAYGKGRGRKKKSLPENLVQKEEDPIIEEQSNKAEDISSSSEPRGDNSISKVEPVTNNSMLKEARKTLLSDLKPSPKNTLVNKLRNTLSKSMQCGGDVKTTSKFSKKSETLKSDNVSDLKHLEKDSPSLKSSFKKNSIETSKSADKTHTPNISHSVNISRRGRKKSVVSQIPVKQNIRGFMQESNDSLSQIDVPSEAIDSSVEVMKTESNVRLQDSSKVNKSKSLRNKSHSGPLSPSISDEKKKSIKKSIANAFQSSKTTKVIKSTKTSLQDANPDAQSSQKTNVVGSKVRSPRGIKPNCDNEPTPSTSYGPSRGRNPRVINIPLDLSSELEDVDDVQQKKSVQKKKPSKVCPICKKKFPALLQRNRHLQLVHGRKKSRNEGSISPTSVPVKKEAVNKVTDSTAIVPDRSAYQRQCSKPLPPMKRKYQKVVEKNIQPVKKTKF